MTLREQIARAICKGCDLDPDDLGAKAAESGHQIPEWMFFTAAAENVLDLIANPSDEMVEQCARAIMEAGGDNPERLCAWPDNDPAWKAAIPEVRAALKAVGGE